METLIEEFPLQTRHFQASDGDLGSGAKFLQFSHQTSSDASAIEPLIEAELVDYSQWLRSSSRQVQLSSSGSPVSGRVITPDLSSASMRISHVDQLDDHLVIGASDPSLLESLIVISLLSRPSASCSISMAGVVSQLCLLGRRCVFVVDGLVYWLEVDLLHLDSLRVQVVDLSRPCKASDPVQFGLVDTLGSVGVDNECVISCLSGRNLMVFCGGSFSLFNADLEMVSSVLCPRKYLPSSWAFHCSRDGSDVLLLLALNSGVLAWFGMGSGKELQLISQSDIDRDLNVWFCRKMLVHDGLCSLLLSDSLNTGDARFLQFDRSSLETVRDISFTDLATALMDFTALSSRNFVFLYGHQLTFMEFDSDSESPVPQGDSETLTDVAEMLLTLDFCAFFMDKDVQAKIASHRKAHRLIFDELLLQLGINSTSFYPPSSENHLRQLVAAIIANEDFGVEEKMCLLYYMACQVESAKNEFAESSGLSQKHLQMVRGYVSFDNGNFSDAVDDLVSCGLVDFPQLILEIISGHISAEELARFVTFFGDCRANMDLLVDTDLNCAFGFARANCAFDLLLEAAMTKNLDRSLCSLPLTFDEEQGFKLKVDSAQNANRISWRAAYGLFLFARSRYTESSEYLQGTKYAGLLGYTSDYPSTSPRVMSLNAGEVFLAQGKFVTLETQQQNALDNNAKLLEFSASRQPPTFSAHRRHRGDKHAQIPKQTPTHSRARERNSMANVSPFSPHPFIQERKSPILSVPAKRQEVLSDHEEEDAVFKKPFPPPAVSRDEREERLYPFISDELHRTTYLTTLSPPKDRPPVDVEDRHEDDGDQNDSEYETPARTTSVQNTPAHGEPAENQTPWYTKLSGFTSWLTFPNTEKRGRTGSSDIEVGKRVKTDTEMTQLESSDTETSDDNYDASFRSLSPVRHSSRLAHPASHEDEQSEEKPEELQTHETVETRKKAIRKKREPNITTRRGDHSSKASSRASSAPTSTTATPRPSKQRPSRQPRTTRNAKSLEEPAKPIEEVSTPANVRLPNRRMLTRSMTKPRGAD